MRNSSKSNEAMTYRTVEEYMAELDGLAKEDWISFRQRLWAFDDFVAAWVEVHPNPSKHAQTPPP